MSAHTDIGLRYMWTIFHIFIVASYDIWSDDMKDISTATDWIGNSPQSAYCADASLYCWEICGSYLYRKTSTNGYNQIELTFSLETHFTNTDAACIFSYALDNNLYSSWVSFYNITDDNTRIESMTVPLNSRTWNQDTVGIKIETLGKSDDCCYFYKVIFSGVAITTVQTEAPTSTTTTYPTNMATTNDNSIPTNFRTYVPSIQQQSMQTINIHSTAQQKENSESDKNLYMIIAILSTIICFTVIFISLCIRHLRAHGSACIKIQRASQNFDYTELIANVDPHPTPGSKYETATITDQINSTLLNDGEDDVFNDESQDFGNEIGENDYDIGINDDELNDQLYAKPFSPSTGQLTYGQQRSQIIHFYYKDFAQYTQDNDHCDQELYHEKQKWELCLLHALNGLLQRQIFTVKMMNDICKELAPDKIINTHKSLLKTGNYDTNVLMLALGKRDIEVEWFDARKADELNLNDEQFLNFLGAENHTFVGFILNNPYKAAFKMLIQPHWIAIRQINGDWYNLDSKLKQAKKYNNADELTAYLVYGLKENNAALMICRKIKSNVKVEMNVALEW